MYMRIIDEKYAINDQGQIVKRSNGEILNEGEPLILFRARDYLALPLLEQYRELCLRDNCTEYQLQLLDGLITRFREFAEQHSEKMKQPGCTRGL